MSEFFDQMTADHAAFIARHFTRAAQRGHAHGGADQMLAVAAGRVLPGQVARRLL